MSCGLAGQKGPRPRGPGQAAGGEEPARPGDRVARQGVIADDDDTLGAVQRLERMVVEKRPTGGIAGGLVESGKRGGGEAAAAGRQGGAQGLGKEVAAHPARPDATQDGGDVAAGMAEDEDHGCASIMEEACPAEAGE